MKKFLITFTLITNISIIYAQVTDANDERKVVFYETYNKSNEIDKISLKDINYKTGEPIFIVVNVEASVPNEDFLGRREQEELKNNFGIKTDFVNYTSNIKFFNRFKTVLKFSYEDSPKKVIYWSGKMDDKPIIFDGIINSSEYFNQYFDNNVYSSYIDLFRNKRNFFTVDFVDNPTDNSTAISNRYVETVASQVLYHMREESNFFKINFKNVKHVTYTTNFDIDIDRLKEIFFDREGRPTKIVFNDLKNENYSFETIFQYENDILRNMISKSNNEYYSETPVFYKDKELYSYSEYAINKFRLDENQFLVSDHYFYDEDKFYFTVNRVDAKKNTLSFTENDHMNDRLYTFTSKHNFFPIKVKIREDIQEEIKKINDKLYIEIGSSNKIEYHFDDNNRINKIVFIEKDHPKENKEINFIYEYYN